MNNTKSQRYLWVDYAKSIGIFLIVCSHNIRNSNYEFLYCFFWTFHVPLFFFISGFLSAKDIKIIDIKKNIERLLLPYIYMYLIRVIFIFSIKLIQEHKFDITDFLKSLVGLFYGSCRYPDFLGGTLWFLVCLLTVKLIFDFFIRKKIWLLIIFCLTSISFYINGVVDNFLSFQLSLLGLNYYFLGYLVRRKNVIFKLQKLPDSVIFIIGFVAFLIVCNLAKNGNVWMRGDSIYTYFRSFMGGAIGCLMITAISLLLGKIIGELKLIKFISLNTIIILGFQAFSNRWALRTIYHFSLISSPLKILLTFILLKILLTTILSMIMLVPFILLINKFLPQIGGRRAQLLKKYPGSRQTATQW